MPRIARKVREGGSHVSVASRRAMQTPKAKTGGMGGTQGIAHKYGPGRRVLRRRNGYHRRTGPA